MKARGFLRQLRARCPSRFAVLVVLGLLASPFVMAGWLALWRLAFALVGIDLFPGMP